MNRVNILTPAKHLCRTARHFSSNEFWWIFQSKRSKNRLICLYLLTLLSFPSVLLHQPALHRHLSPCFLSSSISSFPLFLSLFRLYSQFWAKTFLLIRESAEWNHRGVCSVLTLFIFLLPPYARLHSGNEVELHGRRERVYVCCLTHVCLCV